MKLRIRVVGRAFGALLCAAGAVRAQTTCRNTPQPGPFTAELGGGAGFTLFNDCYTTQVDLIRIQDDGTLTSRGSIREFREKRLVGPEVCKIGWESTQPFLALTDTYITLSYPDAGAGCPAGSSRIRVIVKDTRAPGIGLYPQWSPKELPYTGGNVVLTQNVSDNSAVASVYTRTEESSNYVRRDSVAMALASGTPKGGDWTVTWRVPENQKYSPLTYYMTCVARDPYGLKSEGKCGYVNVAARPDREPPGIAFTVSADTLPAMGGDVVGTVQATDNLGVTRVSTWADKPDGTKTGISYMTRSGGTATNGTWTLTWPLWANGATSPVSWVLHVVAYDAAGNQSSAARTVVVRQKLDAGIPKPILRP